MLPLGNSTFGILCAPFATPWVRIAILISLSACFMGAPCRAQGTPASGTYSPASGIAEIGVTTTQTATQTFSGCTNPASNGTYVQSATIQRSLAVPQIYPVTVANGVIVDPPQFSTPSTSTSTQSNGTLTINSTNFENALQIGYTTRETATLTGKVVGT
jgi:hypothetical protein